MKNIFSAVAVALLLLGSATLGRSQSWQPLNHQPPFLASTALLLTDGTVMTQVYGTGQWWKLAPDNTGSYVNGTWSKLATMPAGYGPLYYGSAVLADGKVEVNGGEYNMLVQDFSTLGAMYDPVANKWTSIAPPSGWGTIGDAQTAVLTNGTFMLANCCTTEEALFNEKTLTWTATGTGKADSNDEEGWTLLPDGTLITVDANNTAQLTNSERYHPGRGNWTGDGSTIVKLADLDSNGDGSHELGPAVLRPDGTVFATGATGFTSVFTPGKPGTWKPGPSFPDVMGQGQLDIADGPAALLPDGNVLCAASPGIFNAPTHFFEFDGATLTQEPATPNAGTDPSYVGRMLLLPTGQVLYTDGSQDVEVYTPAGTFGPAWQPTITSVPTTLVRGQSYVVFGTQFNGLSQANAYGDDAQSATNYPLVRIVNQSTGHVFYARTHNHLTMAVATGTKTVRTHFDVPTGTETGASNVIVVANGIPSAPVAVTVQ